MSPQISVIIPTYKRAPTLARTLKALLANDFPAGQYEVIVVDDAGDEDTEATVAALSGGGAELTYTVNAGRGAAAARNAGARLARGDVLLFLDDDMQVTDTHLADHVRTRREHPDALIGGTRWYSPDSLAALEATSFGRYRISLERAYADGRGEVSADESIMPAPTLASYDLSLSRRSWEALGGFDESFPYAGAEDQDLSRRAVAAGLELIRNNAIKLLHDDPTTTLRDFGLREERGAHTVIAMARKYPDVLGEFGRNDPIMRGDGIRLVSEKLAKEILSLPVSLVLLHRVADQAAALGLPDRVVWPLNRIVVGLHTFLGYREALGLGGRRGELAGSRSGTVDQSAPEEVSSVLLICQEFPGFAVSGGIGTYAEIVARELAVRGVEVHVLCVGTGLPREAHERDGYTVHTAPYTQLRGFGRPLGLPRLGLWVSQAYSVWREYRRLGLEVDVIESPELYAEAAGIALLDRRTPLVVRLHSGFAVLAVPPQNTGLDYRATVAVEDFAARSADIVVSTAPHLASTTHDLHLDPRRTRAIIYPVPERPLAPAVESNVVLFAGRLERRKCPEVLIEAAPEILRSIPSARFRFVGADTSDPERGSYRSFLEALAVERGVADAVEFVGQVPHEQVQVEMSHAGVCAFPSRWESFGLVVADAAAIGRPVVVSNIAAFTDFVSDGFSGRIVTREDGSSWARAIIAALTERERSSEMAAELRDQLQARAAPATVAGEVLESYAAAVSVRKARRGRSVLSACLRRRSA
jgi:glycosyltransferase involved in cell wall biosynthesis/GT2 family glycosyltransferase